MQTYEFEVIKAIMENQLIELRKIRILLEETEEEDNIKVMQEKRTIRSE